MEIPRTVRRLVLALLASSALALGCTSTVSGTGSSSGSSSPQSGSNEQNPTDGTSTAGGGTKTGSGGDGTQSPEFDALFGPPDSSTVTSSLTGVWAGSESYPDVRLKIEKSAITIAIKCSGQESATGVTFAASVTSTSIRVLESKDVGQPYTSCSIQVRPTEVKSCATDSDYECFMLKETTLTFQSSHIAAIGGGSTSSNAAFTKLSD